MQQQPNSLLEYSLERGSDRQDFQRATLNILEDFAEEKARFVLAQAAMLNILEDFDADRTRLKLSQRAFLNILEDIDLDKHKIVDALQRVEAVNGELEEFAYAASHDLKAPLRVIDNASKWLEEDLQEHLTEETRKSMGLLRGRVGRMEKLLDDLLEYSRVGRTTDERYAESLTGDKLISDILGLIAPSKSYTVQVSPNFANIYVRRMPLQQVLMNLITNAIKHHDKNEGRIDLMVEDIGAFYLFAVGDDGPGIPERFHDQIFKMFQTLKPRDQVEGSGMGLAMVRKYVGVVGGTLSLDSAEGKGSIFRFTWPKNKELKRATHE
jgi:signal transduction histidine kinase